MLSGKQSIELRDLVEKCLSEDIHIVPGGLDRIDSSKPLCGYYALSSKVPGYQTILFFVDRIEIQNPTGSTSIPYSSIKSIQLPGIKDLPSIIVRAGRYWMVDSCMLVTSEGAAFEVKMSVSEHRLRRIGFWNLLIPIVTQH